MAWWLSGSSNIPYAYMAIILLYKKDIHSLYIQLIYIAD